MNIFVADDYFLAREGVSMIASVIYPDSHVYQANDWAGVHEILQKTSIDLALVDLFMPSELGWENELVKALQLRPELPVCILSSSDDMKHIQTAFGLGAKGYIHKSANVNEFSDALRRVMSGYTYLPPQFLKEQIFPHKQSLACGITKRQQQVLKLMADGLSNKAIATRLDLSEGTIKRHIYNIFNALNAKNRVQAVQIAQKHNVIETI